MDLLHTVGSFLLIISVIVFIHEFGHYIFAKWCGVKVEAFSIGFGKEIFGWNDRSGTRWKLSLLPLGGYVKMYGDENAASTPDNDKLRNMTEEEKQGSFYFKPLWQKALVVFGGPLFNFLLAIGIFTYFIYTNGITSTEPVIGSVVEQSAAMEAGLQPGDKVLRVDGREVETFQDISLSIATNLGTPIHLDILRNESPISLTLTPQIVQDKDALGNVIPVPRIGIRSQELTFEDVGPSGALEMAVIRTYQICATTFEVLGQLILGDRGVDQLKGPIGIAKMSGQATDSGFYVTLWFMAMLSVNLGMINLFPIPMLDGGHLLFYGIEAMRGRPMGERIQEYSFRVGFALIAMLMAFTIINDIGSLL